MSSFMNWIHNKIFHKRKGKSSILAALVHLDFERKLQYNYCTC